MGTPISNKIVTRGFGAVRPTRGQAGPVTQGYGGPPSFVPAAFRRRPVVGQSGTKRRQMEIEEVIVWAKLIEVNGREPARPIKGWVKAEVNKGSVSARVEHVGTRVREAWETIRVTVRRLTRHS